MSSNDPLRTVLDFFRAFEGMEEGFRARADAVRVFGMIDGPSVLMFFVSWKSEAKTRMSLSSRET